MAKHRAICILGMHRSGTSVVARAVNLLGVYLGEERELLPPAPDNREGVWERRDLVDFHNRVLVHFSRAWHSVWPLPAQWYTSEGVRPFRGELRGLVSRVFGLRPLWAWKDPRTTLLLPLWKNVLGELGIDLLCVYVVRNPLDVAKSLQHREGFPFEKSLGMWFTGNLAALHAIRDIPTIFVSYDKLLGDWEPELRRCARGLDIDWPRDDSRLREGMADFLRPDLRHSASQDLDVLSEQAPQPIIHLYRLLHAATKDAIQVSDPEVRADIERLSREFDEVSSYFRYDAQILVDSERRLQRRVAELEAAAHHREAELERIHRSFAWRIVKRCRKIINRTIPVYTRRRRLYFQIDSGVKIIINDGWLEFFKKVRDKIYSKFWPYKVWRSRNEPSGDQLSAMKAEIGSWSYRPLVSIVMPVFNPSRFALTQCIQSVLDQIYENWELCIVDGGSDQAHVAEVIRRFSSSDPRIKYAVLDKNRGIAGNSNEALKLATGEYVGFLDHDDALAPFALFEVVKLLNHDASLGCIYSDEDKVPALGTKRYDPEFKSDWAPDTFLSYNYLCHFAVVRKKIVDDVGGFREGYDGAQDYDLLLRVVEKTRAIARIPKILYHWRASGASTASGVKVKPYAIAAAKKAIAEHVSRRGLDAEVLDGLAFGTYRVKYRLRSRQKVCIIIPTKDKVGLLKQCVSSVLDKTSYEGFRIIIVDNQSREEETFEFFSSIKNDGRITVLPYSHPFNFSAVNNYAVRSADAEYLVFLNNDTEVISPDWLGAMLEFAQREDVGAVGAKLFYPNDRIQHAGTIIGYWGVADHAHKHFPRSARGYMGRINIIQNFSAVTAACMMVRRTVFDEVGGYDEELSHSFNDVDLCLKIREKGYLIVYTPYAELYHHESVSRGYDEKPEQRLRLEKEIDLVKRRWKHVFEAGDPYYSPNLTLEKTDFSIRL